MTTRHYITIAAAIALILLGLWAGCAIATPKTSSHSETTTTILHTPPDTIYVPMPVVEFVEVPGEKQVITRYYDRVLRDTVQAAPFQMAATRFTKDTVLGADTFALAHTVYSSTLDLWDFRWQPAPRLEIRDTTVVTTEKVSTKILDNRGDFAIGIGPFYGFSPTIDEAGTIGVQQTYGVAFTLSYKLIEF